MLKLNYLAVRSRGEPIRMMLNYGNIKFKDNIIQFEDWPKLKEQSPHGQAPWVELADGSRVSESKAIGIYVAKLVGIYPKDPVKALKADSIYLLEEDYQVIDPILNWYTKLEGRGKKRKDYFKSKLPKVVNIFKAHIGNHNFCGGDDGPHHGDFQMLHNFLNTLEVEPNALNNEDKIMQWIERMKALPGVSEYLQQRPQKGTKTVGRKGSLIY